MLLGQERDLDDQVENRRKYWRGGLFSRAIWSIGEQEEGDYPAPMSAYQPRSTKLGDLPHLSFIKRKPRSLGTEFKSSADGVTGIMLWLEIQEGNSRMKSRAFVGALGANAACALRIALGVVGAGGF